MPRTSIDGWKSGLNQCFDNANAAAIIRAFRNFRLGNCFMPTVRVKENEPFEVAMRRFKRTIEKTGLLTELRAREFYEKPTSERKRKLAAAVKRHYKRLRARCCRRSCTRIQDQDRGFSGCGQCPHFALRPVSDFPAILDPDSAAMSLKARITEDMKTAMRAKDAPRLSAPSACCWRR